MAAYIDLFALIEDVPFGKRVKYALMKSARDVLEESDATPNHVQRLRWANAYLQNSAKATEAEILRRIIAQSGVEVAGGAITDNDLQYVVNGQVNFLASKE